MSSKKSAQPLRLRILPSRQLAIFLLLTHAGAIAVVSQLHLAMEVVVGFTVVIIYSLYANLQKYVGLRNKYSIIEAVWDSDGQWVLLTAFGEALNVVLLPTSVMLSALVLLKFRLTDTWGSRILVLPNDSLDRQTFRHLRIRLRMESNKKDVLQTKKGDREK